MYAEFIRDGHYQLLFVNFKCGKSQTSLKIVTDKYTKPQQEVDTSHFLKHPSTRKYC